MFTSNDFLGLIPYSMNAPSEILIRFLLSRHWFHEFKSDTMVASYLRLCSLWTVPPSFKFHLATLVVLPGDLDLFSLLLLYLIYHAIPYMSTCFSTFFIFFIFLSINCEYIVYFSDNSCIIYIIPMPHQESSST